MIVENKESLHPNFRIVRGIYLTATGQENESYYFKIPTDHKDFDLIEMGMICETFYQGENFILGIPAIIRVDAVISSYYSVQELLWEEKNKGMPLLPIIRVVYDFDIAKLQLMIQSFEQFKQSVSSTKITEEEQNNE